VQDWQNKCMKLYINKDVVDEWARIAKALNDLSKHKSDDSANEMMALLEAELKAVHDVMGKKWRCDAACLMFPRCQPGYRWTTRL
jgi:hypothetical protein